MTLSDSPKSLDTDIIGLILIGGESRRMKRDKSLLDYHDKPQREHLLTLLKKFTPSVYFSCNPAQAASAQKPFPCVVDTETKAGPLGGIISAHLEFPQHAVMVTACDMPFLNFKLVQELYSQRNPAKMATVFRHPDTEFPEPLLAIYEPKGLQLMKLEFDGGIKSPSKLLGKMQVEWLNPSYPAGLINVNDPQALTKALKEIQCHQP